MAGETNTDPPLARAPSQKNLTRRVSFNQTHLEQPPLGLGHNQNPSRDIEAQHLRPRKCASCFNMCCAWGSFVIWTLVVLLLIAGIAFFSFLQSNLPEFRVQRLDLYKLNVTTSKSGEKLLTLDVEFRINVTNLNKNINLHYGPMSVDVAVEGFSLGSEHINEFTQAPLTSKDLRIRSGITKSAVNEDDAKELQWLSERHEMVIFLKFKGTLELSVNGRKFNKLPLKVLCDGIEQSEIDQGHAPECNVKISPFS